GHSLLHTHTHINTHISRRVNHYHCDPPPPETYPLSLHDALPIWSGARSPARSWPAMTPRSANALPMHSHSGTSAAACSTTPRPRSEEHTSELQSREKLVCRLLLETKNE